MYHLPTTTAIMKQLIYTELNLKPAQCEAFDVEVSRQDLVFVGYNDLTILI